MGIRRKGCSAVVEIVMNNYFTYFCLLTHLGVTNIFATGGINKNGYGNSLSLGTNSRKKRNAATLSSAYQVKTRKPMT